MVFVCLSWWWGCDGRRGEGGGGEGRNEGGGGGGGRGEGGGGGWGGGISVGGVLDSDLIVVVTRGVRMGRSASDVDG